MRIDAIVNALQTRHGSTSFDAGVASRRSSRWLVAIVLLCGCYSYHAVPVAPVPRIRGTAHVVRRSGESVDLLDAMITSDSVIGKTERGFPNGGFRVSIANGDVMRIESSELSVARTVGILYIMLGVGAVIAWSMH